MQTIAIPHRPSGARDVAAARNEGRLTSGPPSVSVVIPALNEEQSIEWVLRHVPDSVLEVVLVDGLSTDGTEVVARRACTKLVVVHQRTRGKGAALRAGFAAARGDIIVMIDADGSTDPREMDRFVAALRDGADFVKGSRHLPGGGSVDLTRLRGIGNQGFVRLANLLFGASFTDLCYGYCAFWRHQLGPLALSADGFEIETQLVLNAVKTGLRITEVPSVELERRAGSSNLNVVRDGLRVLWTLVRERLRHSDPSAAAAARIALHSAQVAHPETEAWVPAGIERRRLLAPQTPYEGVERRREPQRVAAIFIAASAPALRDGESDLPRAA